MKITYALIAALLCCCLISCKKKPAPKPKPVPAAVKEPVKKAPVVEEVKTPVRNKIQNHFLIAGCFEYKENADRLSEKLQQEGYDSRIIPYFENLYLVSYDGFSTKQEALNALKEISKEKGKEVTWVYSPRK
ncbi:SPOR domain-containing protein [Porphyromonadaceae bacterium OttesenSCG-928-L07]|nr:SPOR domain-containing protein [Porphyromonadaceae bacterium OttesenSCG-928-L07]MDL2330784.1 SPOR domain-containing protein [Odoribacter sp. OttesenSCG-928-A06]